MSDDPQHDASRLAVDLLYVLNGEPSEEVIHQFFKDRLFSSGQSTRAYANRFISGTVTKFPVAPDRIPDFCTVRLNLEFSQVPSQVTFVELKRPNSRLYTGQRLMSKDLNDAWVECVETSRLIAENFHDFLRRIVKVLDAQALQNIDRAYDDAISSIERQDEASAHSFYDTLMPRCTSYIVIGRRSSLDSEGLLRTRALSASTGYAIRVITYDAVIEWLSAADEDCRDGWHFFTNPWY